jgi:hypothetical protein
MLFQCMLSSIIHILLSHSHTHIYGRIVNIMNTESNEALLIQASAALGSFAKSDSTECIEALIKSAAIPSLLKYIVSSNLKLVESCIRSLKIIYETRKAPTELIFSSDNDVMIVRALIHLLSASNDFVNEVSASLLARCCQTEKHQNIIAHAGGISILAKLLFASYPKVFSFIILKLLSY